MYSFNTAALFALAGFSAVQAAIVSPAPQPTGVKNGTVTITSVYDVYTTVCAGPTSFHLGGKDYVVTEPCTLTITDCPCTVTETHPAGPTWIPGKPYHPAPPKPEHPSKPEHPAKTTGGPQAPESTKPAKGTDVPETPVVVAGAGAVQVGLGLAAMLGLIAL